MGKDRFHEIDIRAFTSVLFAALLLGFAAHEVFHILTISEPSKVTIHFGAGAFSATTCCLVGGDSAMEEVAYLLQFAVMIGWVWLNRSLIVR